MSIVPLNSNQDNKNQFLSDEISNKTDENYLNFLMINQAFIERANANIERYNANLLVPNEDQLSSTLRSITVTFNQGNLIAQINIWNHKHCFEIDKKYGGLCDILCNYVTLHRLLSNEDMAQQIKSEKVLKELEEKTAKTHILIITTLIEKILALIFNIFPYSILSFRDEFRIINSNDTSVNKEVFIKNIEKIETGNYIKFCVFKKSKFSFEGHSMLITKNQDDSFTFFDPNDGMRFNLTQEKLFKIVNDKLEYWHQSRDFNQVVFVNNTKLLNRVQYELDHSTFIVEPEILPLASLNQSLA